MPSRAAWLLFLIPLLLAAPCANADTPSCKGVSQRVCKAVRLVDKQLAQAQKGAATPVTLRLDTTVAFGCPCPPFVFKGVRSVPDNASDVMLYTVPAKGVADPAGVLLKGTYKMTGRFLPQRMDAFGWAKRMGTRPPSRKRDGQEYFRTRHPVFEVTSWCFKRPRRMSVEDREVLKESVPPKHLCK